MDPAAFFGRRYCATISGLLISINIAQSLEANRWQRKRAAGGDARCNQVLLPGAIVASSDHFFPAPTMSRKSSPSHMEKSARASCIMLQKQ
jgi:hypothetical protein